MIRKLKSGQLSSRHLLPGSICQPAPELADSWMPWDPGRFAGAGKPRHDTYALR
jgi:hypothetical protein